MVDRYVLILFRGTAGKSGEKEKSIIYLRRSVITVPELGKESVQASGVAQYLELKSLASFCALRPSLNC